MTRAETEAEIARPDTIVLSVKLKSGGFESSIEVPTDATPARRDACVKQWLGMMQAGLAMSGAEVRASASWPTDAATLTEPAPHD